MPDPFARQRRIGRDDGVDAAGGDAVGDRFDAGVVDVGSDLYGQRNAVAVALRQRVALRGESSEQRIEPARLLQRAQVLRVGRGDVRGDEARIGVHVAQAGDIVVGRAFVRRIEILVETQAVDKRLGFRDTE